MLASKAGLTQNEFDKLEATPNKSSDYSLSHVASVETVFDKITREKAAEKNSAQASKG